MNSIVSLNTDTLGDTTNQSQIHARTTEEDITRQEETADGLEQAQREAIVDLLLLSRYMDNYPALQEDNVFNEEVESFDWDSGTHLEDYVKNVTSRVRNIRSSKDARISFLESVSERLQDLDVKGRALEL